MARSYEMRFQIGGNLASSFSNTFSRAAGSLTGLRNQTRQTQRALNQLGNDFRRGRLTEEQYRQSTERLTHQLERLERAQKRINSLKSTFGQGVDRAKQVAKYAAVGAAAAAAGTAMSSLNKAADFEQQITKAGVIAGATAGEMKKLSSTALDLGAKSSLSASEVAVAMTELGAKGMDTNRIIGSMPGIIHAAEASGEDLALTSDVVTSALNAFNLKATQASHIADVMAMSANKSAAGVADLGYSFKYAAPVAKTLGISLEELAASTGIMVDKGLTGEQAGTSLRMALIRLAKPPKLAQKALDRLNFSVEDSKGKFKSLAQISKDWNEATKDLTQSQKVQEAATVFGVEAATGMLNLFAAGPKKINEMTKALEQSNGAATKAAKAMKDNYAGSLEQLRGSIESAQIKFATPILPVFQDLFDGIGKSIDKNMGGFEKAGKRAAAALRDILDPFSMQKPKLSKDMMHDPEEMAKYQQKLAKYNKFSNMDFGDKVVYSLDEATDKIEKWLSGSGGDSMNKIFTKLGEIAAKAWASAFTGAVKSSLSNLSQGNFAAAGGMGALAWMLGGGLMIKGAIGAGKWGYDIFKGRQAANAARAAGTTTAAASAPRTTTSATSTVSNASRGMRTLRPAASAASTSSRIFGGLKTAGKILGKAALPIAIISEGIGIAKSQDKTRAAVQAGSGIAGGLGGAKLGAAIGTAIAPGIGTAIGGALGGLAGYFGGKWLGGKATDAVRGGRAAAQPVPQNSNLNIDTMAINNNFQALATNTQLVSNNMTILQSYVGQASGWVVGAFTGIKSSADTVKFNLDALVSYTGMASGWMASLNGIQSAGERVIKALNNLEARINSIKLPSPSKRVSYDG